MTRQNKLLHVQFSVWCKAAKYLKVQLRSQLFESVYRSKDFLSACLLLTRAVRHIVNLSSQDVRNVFAIFVLREETRLILVVQRNYEVTMRSQCVVCCSVKVQVCSEPVRKYDRSQWVFTIRESFTDLNSDQSMRLDDSVWAK